MLVPPIDEQRLIAGYLDAVDMKERAEKRRRDALDVLFNTLLENLMTGSLRIADTEVSTA